MGIRKIGKSIGKGILIPLKWVRNIVEVIAEKPIVLGILLFLLVGFLVINATLQRGKSYTGGFLDNILVEAHGLLFDLFVFGILIVIFNRIGEKKRDIRRYQEEIEDFSGWKEKEATFRIVGNIKRLNKRGVTKINLNRCYLKGAMMPEVNLQNADLIWADLQNALLSLANFQGATLLVANLQSANLIRANLQDAILMNANLQDAILTQANLKGVKGLRIDQLSRVKTLYDAKLDQKLEKQVKEKYPHLFIRAIYED